jgi:fructokinase
MLDVLSIGEALVDLIASRPGRLQDAPGFHRYAGGAPANVARALARLGARAGWMWSVGADAFGEFLLAAMSEDGVDVSRAVRTPRGKTGLSFIALSERGERSFTGYGQPDASVFFEPASVDPAYVASARVLHFGSNTLLAEPARGATLSSLAAARDAERLVSMDANLRLHLYDEPARVLAAVRQAAGGADLLKSSEEEARALTGAMDPLDAARALRRFGAGLAVVTLGERGCVWASEAGEGASPAFPVRVVDTTGAGDAFQAALLCALLPHIALGRAPAELDATDLGEVLAAANRAGAAAAGREGAVEWRPQDLPPR